MKRYSTKQVAEVLNNWQRSRLTRKEFCKFYDIKPSTWNYFRTLAKESCITLRPSPKNNKKINRKELHSLVPSWRKK